MAKKIKEPINSVIISFLQLVIIANGLVFAIFSFGISIILAIGLAFWASSLVVYRYSCGDCTGIVGKDAKTCPYCNREFSN